jgi:hypothetical protein
MTAENPSELAAEENPDQAAELGQNGVTIGPIEQES